MIRIPLQPEPAAFQERVRVPGTQFLGQRPQPTAAQWKTHAYWRRVLADLHRSYRGICAYSCHWIPLDTGASTVDHFRPKDAYPLLAYEWGNYRLVALTLNARKREFEDVVDPIAIQTGWLVLDFPSLMVRPADDAPDDRLAILRSTVARLGLNDEGTCLQARREWLRPYCDGQVNFNFLQERAPFIALELERQGLVDGIIEMMAP